VPTTAFMVGIRSVSSGQLARPIGADTVSGDRPPSNRFLRDRRTYSATHAQHPMSGHTSTVDQETCPPTARKRFPPSASLRFVGAAICCGAALIALSALFFGSISAAWAFFAGRTFWFDDQVTIASADRQHSELRLKFRIQNLSGRRTTIVGAKSTCSCVATSQLPMTVEPWRTAEIEIQVHRGPESAQIDESIEPFTDSDSHPRIFVRVSD